MQATVRMRALRGVMGMGALTIAAAALLAVTRIAGAQVIVGQEDLARGQTLYETHCGGCHDRSVHGRAVRSARTYEEIRAYVVRWQKEAGLSWKPDDVDAVTAFLNERYYRLPCPTTVCAVPRAAAPR